MRIALLLVILSLLLTSCASAPPAPTRTPVPTATARPTQIPRPTAVPKTTRAPNPTARPKATAAPKTTATPRATAVPRATAAPKTTERQQTSASAPCLAGQVKANRNSGIYHVPGGASYGRTSVNVACYDTAAEAQAAGFRRAQR